MKTCDHKGQVRRAEYDAQGIFLCYVCPKCKAEKLKGYRPEILTGYSQKDVDEPIEAESGCADGW
jgi:hypothetical protein